MSLQFVGASEVTSPLKLTTAGLSVRGIQGAFRYFTLESISPATATVYARMQDSNQSAGSAVWFPLSIPNPTMIRRPLPEAPYQSMEFYSDTANTTISFYWSLTDEYIPAPAGPTSASGGSSVLIEGVDASTGALHPIAVGALGGTTGLAGEVIITQQYDTHTSATYSAASGGTLTLTPKEACGKAKISLNPSATTGLGIATFIQVQGTDANGTRAIPVFDQNGVLISPNGQISALEITRQTTPTAAAGIADFFVDAATFSAITVVTPVFTGVATMSVGIVAGPEVASAPLNVANGRQSSTISIAAGASSVITIPTDFQTLSIAQTTATPQAYTVSLYNGANLVGSMPMVGIDGDAVMTAIDYVMRSINLAELPVPGVYALQITAYATNSVPTLLTLVFSNTPINRIRNLTYNAYDILGHAATTADTLGGTFTNFSFSCKGARSINWKTTLTSTAAAQSALNWTSVSPAFWLPIVAILTFTGAGSSALFASLADTTVTGASCGAYLLRGTGVTNVDTAWSVGYPLLPANIFGFQVVAGTGTPPQILDINIVLNY